MKTLGYSLLLALALLLIFHLSARADIAPPDQPSGANPVPGTESTLVRMLAEEVLIEVQGRAPQSSLGQARVTARFTMQNQGDQDERMAVRFPLTFFGHQTGDRDPTSEIKDVKIKVRGISVPTRRVDYGWQEFPASPWVEFQATFPLGEKVPVEVTYLQEGVGEYPFISLDYTLETGAGWNGSIGTADLIVRLPYDANPHNVIFEEQIGWSQTTPGGVIDGREVRWHFENLDPTWEHNLQVSLVLPRAWRQALDEQARIAENPGDGEAWGRLGKLYKEFSRLRRGHRADPGGQELYRLSAEAYEKSLELLPEDAAWHAGYADLLWWHFYYDQSFRDQPDYGEMLRALQELDRALALDPDQEKAEAVLEEISFAVPEAVALQEDTYELFWLTATPTRRPNTTPLVEVLTPSPPSPAPALSLTPSQPPASTTLPTKTLTSGKAISAMHSPAAPTPVSAQSTPAGRTGGLCAGAALLPLAAVLWLGWRKTVRALRKMGG